MEDIKAKIMALMAKTTQNGCTEEEAIAASRKVQELLHKYQLSLSDIRIKEEKCVTGEYDTQLKAKSALNYCIVAISKFTDTKCWRSIRNDVIYYKYFGFEHDVLIAEYITKLIDWAIIYAGEDFKDSSTYRNSTKRSKILEEFKIAMAWRLNDRLNEMKAAQDNTMSSGKSLIVVKDAIVTEEYAKLNMKLSKGKKGTKRLTSYEAYAAGTAAGDKVSINPGLRSENDRRETLS